MKRRQPGIPKSVLVAFDGNDVDDIAGWVPDDANEVSEWVNLTIGTDRTGGDNFQVHICTPSMAKRQQDKRGLLVVPFYEDWSSVLEALDEVFDQCRGFTWSQMCEKLSKRFIWEYEGMARMV